MRRAEKVYQAGPEPGTGVAEIHDELGRMLLQRGEIEQAERELQAAVSLDPRAW